MIIVLLIVVHVFGCELRKDEPRECSRFDYEYKVLERILQLEQRSRMLENECNDLKKVVKSQQLLIESLQSKG